MLDMQGRAIGIIGISRDITARKKMEEVAVIERNLAIILAQKSDLEEALPLCLDLALQFSEMDCGGIYLLDRQKQELVLMTHKGLSDAFVAQASKIKNGSERYRLALSGAPLYQPYRELPTKKNPSALAEGLHASAIIPARFNDEVIACINVASHRLDDIPGYRRRALENLANQIGSMIGRFQAQAELAESQQELQSMFNSLQDYVFVLDDQGCILQVNQKVMDNLGYSRAELVGSSVLMTHPPEQHVTAWQIVQDMLAGLMDTCPLDLQRKDGSLIPVETKVARGRWGNREALIGVSRDISERKAADEARLKQARLLEYRHKFEETLTSISTRFINLPSAEINPEINHVLKQIGEFEQVDRSYVFLVDQAAAQMTNTHEWCPVGIESQIDQLQDIPTSIFPWWLEKLEKLEEVYIPVVCEMPAEAQAERELLEQQSIQSVLVVPLVANNRMVGFLGFDSVKKQRLWSPDSILLIKMVGDILSNALMRFKMQSDLMQSESRNTALLSAVPDMIFRIRRDGVFLDYKASSPDFLAVSGEQIKGASLSSILPEALTSEAMVLIEQALQTQEIQSMEYTLKIGDAAHVFEARFKDSGEDEVTAIVREISDRARLEQMKSDFINQATHELRTPIATMLLMVNLIDGDSTAEEFQQYWDVLKSELSREQLLVENLLSAGRLEKNQVDLHFRFMDITEILKQTLRQLELPAREKNILLSLQITETLDEGVYILNVDENALSQVFVNLLGNAIKFTPAGGQVNIGLRSLNLGVEVSIRDSGIGIPSEDIPLLFNRFFRGSNAVQDEIPGTGIGLFIVRSILEKHSGSIKAHSTLGQGSQFDVWLPVDQT
jgi:PAS domain S-box-containing protein